MKKAILTAIIAASLIGAPNLAKTSSAESRYATVRYDSCGFLEGLNTGLSFGLALIEPHTRRCVLEHERDGRWVHPDGYYKCTVKVQDGKVKNYNCPRDVFNQVR
jgi:hypothetical protein